MKLWPFFSFYGGKWRAAPRYPTPRFPRIVEPFAGAAGYSVRYAERDVVLVEKDPVVASLWRYLITATPEDIRRLPLIRMEQSIEELDVAPAASSLIGFWLNKATTSPCKRPSAWMRGGLRPKSFWSPEIRERIASQVDAIKHWTVIEGDYTQAPEGEATWFIDPPYAKAGQLYRHKLKAPDFPPLAAWCQSRPGQVMVCENEGADWLPFRPYITIKSTESAKAGRGKAKSHEALWTNE